MEADKIKKKLNGTILKGKRFKVEEARPAKRKHVDEVAEHHLREDQNLESVPEARKKSKKENNVILGHELSPGRKVKRGWTETKSERGKKDKSTSHAKPQAVSKYTEKEELLFKTGIQKKRTTSEEKNSRKKTKPGKGVEVVHEFKNSTKIPTFLRNEASGAIETAVYHDGKGWVDQSGNVVEAEAEKISKRTQSARPDVEKEVTKAQLKKPSHLRISVTTAKKPVTNSSPEQTSSDSENSVGHEDDVDAAEKQSEQADGDDETSSSGDSSSFSSSDDTSEDSSESEAASTRRQAVPLKQAAAPNPSVHPLEALFKKPSKPASSQGTLNLHDVAKPSLEVQTSFSFFDRPDDNDDLPPIPMTPFSSQDVRTRETRSAAPTPDTAHPSRMSSIFNGEESEGELSEMEQADTIGGLGHMGRSQIPEESNLKVPQTDFEKQFWEKRGENNRSWKARRRAVLKEKRQRENRARRPKNW